MMGIASISSHIGSGVDEGHVDQSSSSGNSSSLMDQLSRLLEMNQNSTEDDDNSQLLPLNIEKLRCDLNIADTADIHAILSAANIPREFYSPASIASSETGSAVIADQSGSGVGSIERTVVPELLNNGSSSLWPQHDNQKLDDHTNHSLRYCPRNFDGILCWQEVQSGLNASMPCFTELNGIPYDTSYNATRFCKGGNWTRSEYGLCQPIKRPTTMQDDSLEITTGVYFYGYCLSLSALVMALLIFLTLKELRCLRNTIHTHLIVTYILSDAMWIITSFTTFTYTSSDAQSQAGQTNQVSCITFIVLHYFHLTNFFWSFVEGLYLYVLVVQTFVAENIKLRVYAFIGWGLPLIVVISWSLAKNFMVITSSASSDIQSTDPEFHVSTCLWLTVSVYDWIYKSPVIVVLAANMIFLVQIMWVLITKLRSATNPETQQSRKAAKALVVLMPLLGITYVLVLSGSKTPVYEFLRAFLISTQGFLVSLLYCFLNTEVRLAIRHRYNRLRTLGFGCSRCTCWDCDGPSHTQQIRELSPRTGTESIRFYGAGRPPNRQRDSTVSETTLTTSLNGNSAGLGSSHRLSSSIFLSSLQKSPSTHTTNLPLTVENDLYI